MAKAGFRVLDRQTVATAGFLEVERLHVIAPDGSAAERVAIRHPGAVAMVPVLEDRVLLINQYRAPIDRWLLELPAGKLDEPGEDLETTARRELEEELGYRPGRLEQAASFYTTPGFTDELMWIFIATELEPVPPRPHGPEEREAEVVAIQIDDLRRMMVDGEIEDAKTLIGLSMFLESR